ncbi:MAG: GDSL-type esterase/lipase family protein [Thermodesulfobacteriota bacterium]
MSETVLFIGDSLIAYHDWQQSFPQLDCRDHGVPGATMAELHDSLPAIFSRQRQEPRGIVVMIGTNNLLQGDFSLLATFPQLLSDLKALAPQAKIIITSLPPLAAPWLAADATARLNRGIREICEAAGGVFIDLHQPFAAADGDELFLEDGVHLSPDGYRLWCQVLAPELARLTGQEER